MLHKKSGPLRGHIKEIMNMMSLASFTANPNIEFAVLEKVT